MLRRYLSGIFLALLVVFNVSSSFPVFASDGVTFASWNGGGVTNQSNMTDNNTATYSVISDTTDYGTTVFFNYPSGTTKFIVLVSSDSSTLSVPFSLNAANGTGVGSATSFTAPTGSPVNFSISVPSDSTQAVLKVPYGAAGANMRLYEVGTNLADVSVPSPPASAPSVTGTSGDGSVSLSWSSVSGASSYNVYQNGSKIASNLQTNSYSITGLTNGTSYSFQVSAVNASGESPLSSVIHLTPDPAIPAAPSSISATPTDSQVSLSWSAVSGATSYNLYRNGSLLQSGLISTSYVDSAVSNKNSYSYQVTAVNAGGESPKSATVSATPSVSPPSSPTASGSAGNGQVVISWSAVSGSSSYNLYRDGSVYKSGLTGTSFTDSPLTNGVTYSYNVTSVNSSGESAFSNTVNLTPVFPAPSVSPTPIISNVGSTSFVVGVSPVYASTYGASYYDVYVNGQLKAGNVSSSSMPVTVSGLVYGTSYSVTMDSGNGSGKSPMSSTVSVMTSSGFSGGLTSGMSKLTFSLGDVFGVTGKIFSGLWVLIALILGSILVFFLVRNSKRVVPHGSGGGGGSSVWRSGSTLDQLRHSDMRSRGINPSSYQSGLGKNTTRIGSNSRSRITPAAWATGQSSVRNSGSVSYLPNAVKSKSSTSSKFKAARSRRSGFSSSVVNPSNWGQMRKQARYDRAYKKQWGSLPEARKKHGLLRKRSNHR